jgi:hypothetical protein
LDGAPGAPSFLTKGRDRHWGIGGHVGNRDQHWGIGGTLVTETDIGGEKGTLVDMPRKGSSTHVPSFLTRSLNHVSPRAFAKWSSTEPGSGDFASGDV